jgi:hypothetical protein
MLALDTGWFRLELFLSNGGGAVPTLFPRNNLLGFAF